MKILHIINSLSKGGAERLLVDVLPLYPKEIDLKVLELTSRFSENQYIEVLENAGVSCYSLGGDSVRSIAILFKLYRFLKKGSFDVIHVHLFPSLYFVSIVNRILRLNCLLIYTEHSTQNKRSNKKYLRWLEKFIYGSFDKIIAISPMVDKRMKEWLGNIDKIVMIRNGVNIERFFNINPYDTQFIRDIVNRQSTDIFKIVMVARFFYPKDQVTVIRALRLLPKRYHVFFVGDGRLMESCVQLASDFDLNDRIHFLGFRSEIPQLMNFADINVLSSHYEGMSGVTLESLSGGKPFLGSDVPGINDVVPDSRFLFKPSCPSDLAKKILEISCTPELAKDMKDCGLKFVQQFTIQLMISKHINLYKTTNKIK